MSQNRLTPTADLPAIAEGHDFLWHGIDLDQRADGAWGRVRAPGDRMQLRDATFIGSGRRVLTCM